MDGERAWSGRDWELDFVAHRRNVARNRALMESPNEIAVFSLLRDSRCAECGRELLRGEFLRMENEQPHCLDCADLGHLVYLPRGDTALTRRSRKYSALSAVVVEFSRSRGRYERQGVLVEAEALRRAEAECEADEARRARARVRAAIVRERHDEEFQREFAVRLKARYPGCPEAEAEEIVRHACRKHSGRIGRSALAREFDLAAIALAVRAHIRHAHTRYDRLRNGGVERGDARAAVAATVNEVEARWSKR